ncbi:MAG: hypothetical protein QGF53_06230 [Alphaproteobacteria bacterium]|jgi:hypothetical protein|nr:hypothetical protein [Alphaproteobacteria bacterium]
MPRPLALLLAFAVFAAWTPNASALTVTNEGSETMMVWIEKWMYRLREGKTATFIPTTDPVTIIIESRHFRISCEAGAESVVTFDDQTCTVDGTAVGDSQMQL